VKQSVGVIGTLPIGYELLIDEAGWHLTWSNDNNNATSVWRQLASAWFVVSDATARSAKISDELHQIWQEVIAAGRWIESDVILRQHILKQRRQA